MENQNNCDHNYTPNYTDVFGSPSCEKCGKLMPETEQE